MRCLAVVLCAVAVFAPPPPHHDHHHDDFTHMINHIQDSHQFHHLPMEQQQMFRDLVTAAQNGPDDLTQFIDNTGLVKLLEFIEHMEPKDATMFEEYLAQVMESASTGQPMVSVPIRKREYTDFTVFMQEMKEVHEIVDHMKDEDAKEFMAIFEAAHSNTLTSYIGQHGYGPLFKLMSHVDGKHNDDLLHMVERHLYAEAQMKGTTMGSVDMTTMGMPMSSMTI